MRWQQQIDSQNVLQARLSWNTSTRCAWLLIVAYILLPCRDTVSTAALYIWIFRVYDQSRHARQWNESTTWLSINPTVRSADMIARRMADLFYSEFIDLDIDSSRLCISDHWELPVVKRPQFLSLYCMMYISSVKTLNCSFLTLKFNSLCSNLIN